MLLCRTALLLLTPIEYSTSLPIDNKNAVQITSNETKRKCFLSIFLVMG